MKLTGKYLSDIQSSFVEFEVDELPTKGEQENITEEASCYEAIWMGEAKRQIEKSFGDSPTLMIGMDDCEMSDIDLLEAVMSEEDIEQIREIKRICY